MSQLSQWSGQPSIRGSFESAQMVLLAFTLLGMVFVWSLETTYCTPYLLQLGLSKTKTSFVWLAGPASSIIMQPIVGALTDRSTSKYGRRRPAMIGSAIVTGAAVILLGWTGEFVALFVDAKSTAHQNATIVVAVLSIYAVDFAINVVQACGRSLIVDVLPIPKQQLGTAWAARMGATGHILAYLIGLLDLVAIFPAWLGGDTQFKKMTVVSAVFLWLAVGVTSYAVTERVLLKPGGDINASVTSVLSNIWYQCFHLPERIQKICWVQFWSWIGWFPVLFYGSTWVGETYYRYEHPVTPEEGSQDVLGTIGRLGSTAFVIFSVINFASAFLIPLLVKPPDARLHHYTSFGFFSSKTQSRFFEVFHVILKNIKSLRPDLVTGWILSNLFFASICFLAPFVKSLAFATTIIALAGIPWAVTVWAPFAEMGVEINRLTAEGRVPQDSRASERVLSLPVMNTRAGGYAPVPASFEDNDNGDAVEMEEARPSQHRHGRRSRSRSNPSTPGPSSPSSSHPRRTQSFSSGILRLNHPPALSELDASTGELAGVYLGVLNIYSTLPQFLGTAINWLIFLIFEPGRAAAGDGSGGGAVMGLQKDGPNAIAICLLVGAICSCIAAEAGRRLRKIS